MSTGLCMLGETTEEQRQVATAAAMQPWAKPSLQLQLLTLEAQPQRPWRLPPDLAEVRAAAFVRRHGS